MKTTRRGFLGVLGGLGAALGLVRVAKAEAVPIKGCPGCGAGGHGHAEPHQSGCEGAFAEAVQRKVDELMEAQQSYFAINHPSTPLWDGKIIADSRVKPGDAWFIPSDLYRGDAGEFPLHLSAPIRTAKITGIK